MNLGVTSVAAPKAASSSTARYSWTARPAACGGRAFSPSIPFCRLADGKGFATNQTFSDAAPQDCLKDAPQQIALAEPAMPVLGEGGVIGDSAIEPGPAEPSVGQIEMNPLAQPSLRAYAEAVAYDEHAHHQLGIDRGPSDAAVEPSQLPPQLAKFDKSVYRPQEMIGRYVPFERERIEQRSLFDLPMSHHDLQSCLPQRLNQ